MPIQQMRGLLLPLYIVLSMSPDIKQQANRRRSAYCGSSSAWKDVASPPKVPFSGSILRVIKLLEMKEDKSKAHGMNRKDDIFCSE